MSRRKGLELQQCHDMRVLGGCPASQPASMMMKSKLNILQICYKGREARWGGWGVLGLARYLTYL